MEKHLYDFHEERKGIYVKGKNVLIIAVSSALIATFGVLTLVGKRDYNLLKKSTKESC